MHEDRAKDIAKQAEISEITSFCGSVEETAQYHLDKVYEMGRIAGLREAIEYLGSIDMGFYVGAIAHLESRVSGQLAQSEVDDG